MNGFLNLLKPPGMTSSDAVVAIRRTLDRGTKVGHAGTLDPEAAGVLPIMIGKAARLFDVMTDKEKEYMAEAAFGTATDTQDAQGRVVETGGPAPTRAALEAALPAFTGDIEQVPPAFSALSVGGRRAYDLAREGKTVALAPRRARIDDLELLEMGEGYARLRVVCGRGVYIRTLCHDLGRALGCPAHLRFLLRTRSGGFSIDQSVTLEEWNGAEHRAGLLSALDAPLNHLPRVRAEESEAARVRNGNPLRRFRAEGELSGGPVLVYLGDRFAGLGRVEDGCVRFQAMLMENEGE